MVPRGMPQTRYLGRGRVEFSPLGLGCMGLSSTCGPANEGQSIRTVHRAIELGVGLFDTADVYGLGHNEKLLARALAGRRSHVLVASKLGWIWDEEGKLVGGERKPRSRVRRLGGQPKAAGHRLSGFLPPAPPGCEYPDRGQRRSDDKAWGTLVALVFLGIITNAMTLLNMSECATDLVNGLPILFAVLLNSIKYSKD